MAYRHNTNNTCEIVSKSGKNYRFFLIVHATQIENYKSHHDSDTRSIDKVKVQNICDINSNGKMAYIHMTQPRICVMMICLSEINGFSIRAWTHTYFFYLVHVTSKTEVLIYIEKLLVKAQRNFDSKKSTSFCISEFCFCVFKLMENIKLRNPIQFIYGTLQPASQQARKQICVYLLNYNTIK